MLSRQACQEWNWQGHPIKLVDGTTITLPDTVDNQAHYPQSDQQAKGVGFPIVRLVGILDYASGALLDVAMGAYKGKGTGEYSLFRQIMDKLDSGDVLLGDAYYCSYFGLAEQPFQGDKLTRFCCV